MLTLSRREGHAIRIGDNIRIVISEIRGNTVRIGIEAPREMQVFREELWIKIQEENRAAAEGPDRDALDAFLDAFGPVIEQEIKDGRGSNEDE
jgi:carbon storage regulator